MKPSLTIGNRRCFGTSDNEPGKRIRGSRRKGTNPTRIVIRPGWGKMMGVDFNKKLDWVGASAGFFPSSALEYS